MHQLIALNRIRILFKYKAHIIARGYFVTGIHYTVQEHSEHGWRISVNVKSFHETKKRSVSPPPPPPPSWNGLVPGHSTTGRVLSFPTDSGALYPEYPPNLSGKKGEVPNDFHIPRGYLHIPLQTLPAAAVCKPGTERSEQGPVECWNGGSSCLLSCWLVVGGCTQPPVSAGDLNAT